jgi:hypothetical protein
VCQFIKEKDAKEKENLFIMDDDIIHFGSFGCVLIMISMRREAYQKILAIISRLDPCYPFKGFNK